jgi:cytochrome c-type biogenesis protein CcmH/NrfG
MKKENVSTEYAKRPDKRYGMDTLVLLAAICLTIGFVGGVVFKAYQVGSSRSVDAPPHSAGGMEHEHTTHSVNDIEELRAIAVANPGSADAWRHLGDAYFNTDQFEDAILAYKKTLEIDPSNADVWTDLGVMYRRSGNPEKAIEAFDRAFERDSGHQVSRFNKGVVLLQDLNDPKGAAVAWRELLRINPDARTPAGVSVREILDGLDVE